MPSDAQFPEVGSSLDPRVERKRLLFIVADQGRGYLADQALVLLARAAGSSYDVAVATAQPTITHRRTGLSAIGMKRTQLLAACHAASAVVVVGGELGDAPSRDRCAGLSVADLLTLAHATRRGGGNWVMWGMGLGAVTNARTRFLIRTLVKGSDLFLAESGRVARRLVELGVPAPVRKGVGLIWLGLCDLDLSYTDAPARSDEVRIILGRSGTDPTAEHELTAMVTSVLNALGTVEVVGVQPWLMGRDAELALDALGHQIRQLQSRGFPVSAVLPDRGVEIARERLADNRLLITSSEGAIAVAISAGVPTIYVADSNKAPVATRLGVPVLTIGEYVCETDAAIVIDHAEAQVLAARQSLLDLRDRADGSLRLIQMLLDPDWATGRDRHHLGDDPYSGIRPIGVLR